MNIYRYCSNNVVNATDPSGLCPPITRDGQIAIDDDGKGEKHDDPDHKPHTSGKMDKNGDIVPAGDTEGLNADTDSYGVAPKDLASANGGPLNVGDKMDVTLPDGTTIHTRIGDFGPEGGNGEISKKAADDAGIATHDVPGKGPIPGKDSKSPDIKVKVTYYPGTHKK